MITVRRSAVAVAGVGALAVLLLMVGADSAGGVLALLQLGLLVGTPLALVLHDELRSWLVVLVVAFALSIALSAIAVQFLVWFRMASAELVVLSATTYGVVLALLLSSADLGRPSSRAIARRAEPPGPPPPRPRS